MIQSDRQIRHLCEKYRLLEPYQPNLVGRTEKVLSWGPSSYGYDIQLGTTFKETIDKDAILDPKTVSDADYVMHTRSGPLTVPPGGFILGHSVEYFRMPANITGLVKTKSTYARLGIVVGHDTVIEAGWEGILTIEIANHGTNPVRIYPGEGIAQVVFFKATDECDVSYGDRAGKYNRQSGVTVSRI